MRSILGMMVTNINPVTSQALEYRSKREWLSWEQKLRTYGDVTYQSARPNMNWREKLLNERYIHYKEGGVEIQSELRD